MPSALKLKEEYGDDLVVIFVESQGAEDTAANRFALERKWLGKDAMWTTERPFDSGSRGLPSFGLVGVDGKLVLKGSSSSLHGAMKEAIAEQVELVKKGPAGLPKPIRKHYADFAKGKYAKAIADLEALAADEGDAEMAAHAAGAVADMRDRVDAMLRRADWLLENGFAIRADELVGKLGKGLKGHEELAGLAAERATALASPDMKAELSAAKALVKLEASLYESGSDEKVVKKIQKFIDKNSGTKAAARAQRLVELAS